MLNIGDKTRVKPNLYCYQLCKRDEWAGKTVYIRAIDTELHLFGVSLKATGGVFPRYYSDNELEEA